MSSPYYPSQNPNIGKSTGPNVLVIILVILLIVALGFTIGYLIYKAKNPTPGSTGCTGDSDCPGSTPFCQNSICVAGPTGCNISSDCFNPSFPICQNGTCIAKCDASNPCTGTQACVSGVCQLNCTTTRQCNSGQVCDGGICQEGGVTGTIPTCNTNDDCSGGLVCLSGICENCTSNSQCDPGETCNSLGVCITPGVTSTYKYINGSWTGSYTLVWDPNGSSNDPSNSYFDYLTPAFEYGFSGSTTLYQGPWGGGSQTTSFNNSNVTGIGANPVPGQDQIYAACPDAFSECSGVSGTSPVNLPSSFSKITMQQSPLQLIITP